MQAVKLSFADILKIEGNVEHYHIPKYQREYVWGKYHWETLLNDINDNDPEYFIGSVIVVNQSSTLRPGEEKIYQVIDGQQRLTTISILLAAIHYKYNEWAQSINEDDDDLKSEYIIKLDSIKKKLLKKKKEIYPNEIGSFKDGNLFCFLRVQPSTQNNNLADYQCILQDCGLLKNVSEPKFLGLRRFWKAYDYFWQNLPDTKVELDSLLDKINRLVFIHISVGTQSDAFTLFETLNNRGVDLSPIDILKNSLLAEMEKQHGQDIDTSYDNWQLLLSYIPDFENQLRFLRQYYNAFKVYEKIRHERISRATKSNILQIYERLIKNNADFTFTELLEKGNQYGLLIGTLPNPDSELNNKIIELNRVGAATSYTLLLFLFSNKKHISTSTSFAQIVDFIIKYYVRRNVTDTPNTRDLDAVTIEIIEKCYALIKENHKIELGDIMEAYTANSKAKPASLDEFEDSLSGDVYLNNVGMTRYLLWKLDSLRHTREYAPDLWQRNPNNDNYVWTIEHVFPEGQNIPAHWIDMIADGDEEKAKEIQYKVVHLIGNLTLSAYNSNLSNRAFKLKQDLSIKKVGDEELTIGYKNGLSINNLKFKHDDTTTSLGETTEWNQDLILARTQVMVKKLIALYKFDSEI